MLKENERQKERDKLNSIRDEIIKELAYHEKQLMDNADTLVLGEAWTKSRDLLAKVNKEIAFVFDENKYSEWINYEVPYARIARKILENSFKLEELAMGKQTFKFYHNEKNPGILIHLKDVHLNAFEQNCFR